MHHFVFVFLLTMMAAELMSVLGSTTPTAISIASQTTDSSIATEETTSSQTSTTAPITIATTAPITISITSTTTTYVPIPTTISTTSQTTASSNVPEETTSSQTSTTAPITIGATTVPITVPITSLTTTSFPTPTTILSTTSQTTDTSIAREETTSSQTSSTSTTAPITIAATTAPTTVPITPLTTTSVPTPTTKSTTSQTTNSSIAPEEPTSSQTPTTVPITIAAPTPPITVPIGSTTTTSAPTPTIISSTSQTTDTSIAREETTSSQTSTTSTTAPITIAATTAPVTVPITSPTTTPTTTSTSVTTPTVEKSSPAALAICLGVIIPIVVLVVVVIIIIVRYKKVCENDVEDPRSVDKVFPQQSSKPVPVDGFAAHVEFLAKDSGLEYTAEYDDLKLVGKDQPWDQSDLPCNRDKNRYTNIKPYDISRVKLLPVEDVEGSDYINASWMPGFNSKREYIAAQGPLLGTTEDFWRMIWEYDCRAIVMVTKCVEQGRNKCEQYWPLDTEPVFYGDLQVAITQERLMENWDIRDFQIKMGQQARRLRHFHFKDWPDHGVPDKATLLKFVQFVRDEISPRGGPMVVHCSAGVGRTGTFIAIDTILRQLDRQQTFVDIYGIVYCMRLNRVSMVQTESQYIFIHDVIRHHLENPMDTSDENIDDESLYPDSNEIKSCDTDTLPLVSEKQPGTFLSSK